MNKEKIRAAIAAYKTLEPSSIDVFRDLTEEEAVVVSMTIEQISSPAKRRGRPRKAKEAAVSQ